MGLSGRISQGMQGSLDEILKRDLLLAAQAIAEEQRQIENERAVGDRFESGRRFDVQQAGEQADRAENARRLDATLARQAAQDDIAATGRRQEANERGLVDMAASAVEQGTVDPNDPEGRRQLGTLLMRAGDRSGLELATQPPPETPEQKEAREFGEWKKRADYQEGQMRNRPARPARTELTPGQAFSATRQLRNDFVRETQAAREVQNQFRLMQSAIDAARKGDMAAGSQGVLVTFQKILDPTSVVRESEYARSASGQALLSRIEGAAQKLAQGGAGIPVRELESFVALAGQFAQNQAAAASETKAQIDAIAEEYSINPANITREYGGGPAATPAGGAQRKPIPGIPGAEAESTDGGKTWRRVK